MPRPTWPPSTPCFSRARSATEISIDHWYPVHPAARFLPSRYKSSWVKLHPPPFRPSELPSQIREVGLGALTTVVLLVLAGIWAAVIAVPLVRAKSEGKLGDSIGSFRRHLSVLERAAPLTVAPANRLRIPSATAGIRPIRPMGAAMARPTVSRGRRRMAQKRRRDVFVALVVAMAGSALLAMIPGLSIMWTINIVIDVMFVAYVLLLVRMRSVAAEREMKLTFLPGALPVPARYDDSHVAVGLANLARRAAN